METDSIADGADVVETVSSTGVPSQEGVCQLEFVVIGKANPGLTVP